MTFQTEVLIQTIPIPSHSFPFPYLIPTIPFPIHSEAFILPYPLLNTSGKYLQFFSIYDITAIANEETIMNSILVLPADKGKYKVLYRYVQYGVAYSTKEQAEKEANELKGKLFNNLKRND